MEKTQIEAIVQEHANEFRLAPGAEMGPDEDLTAIVDWYAMLHFLHDLLEVDGHTTDLPIRTVRGITEDIYLVGIQAGRDWTAWSPDWA